MSLAREAELVQNPALGAVLIWRFACGYRDKSPTSAGAPVLLAFIVLPLLLHTDTFASLRSTQKGLRAFAAKFVEAGEPRGDMVLAIHDRTARWRAASLAALGIGVRARLVTILRGSALLVPLSEAEPSGVPASIRPLLKAADKLGGWCASLSLFEVASILKVSF